MSVGILVRGARGARVSVWVGAVALVVGACTTGSPAAQPSEPTTSGATSSVSTEPPPKPISFTLVPKDKASNVAPGRPITVSATDGVLTEVVLTNEAGKRVSGELAEDGSSWRATEPLGYGKTYTTTATGRGSDGNTTTVTATFSTARPAATVGVSMYPLPGSKVGVGQPLIFYFDSNIPNKAAAERAIEISTSPEVEGAFYWYSDSEVHWRPKEFWPAGTKVTIDAAIYGKRLGRGLYGAEDRRSRIQIGDAIVATMDGKTHKMTVTKNGEVLRRLPISMGRPGHETPEGTYVAMSEHSWYTMDSSTYGVPADSPAGYRITVEVATRLSNSGIFYHSAPWSLADQGHRNVSHGCINLSPKNAAWLQKLSQPGDVYIVKRTGGQQLEHWDGMGDWQIPWPQWQRGNR